jgi:hypothetical protein
MRTEIRQLLAESREELDARFKAAPAGPIPDGEGAGTAVVCSGSICARPIAWFVRSFLWQGKVFDARSGTLVNRLGLPSVRAIRAKVYEAPSWNDGRPCVVLDYSRTSFVARKIRDEIREIEPGLYLGQVWWGKKRLVDFVVSRRGEPPSVIARRVVFAAALLALAVAAWLAVRLTSDRPVDYDDPRRHFMYGSTGGERTAGIPLSIWNLLPELFPEHLPGKGLESLGFIYEDGAELPIGVSKRRVQGIDRVFVNCAVCHVGTYRMSPDAPRQIVVGMPAHSLDLQGFERFLFRSAADKRFTASRIGVELRARRADDALNRLLYRLIAVDLMRDNLLMLRDEFSQFMDREPDCGPGRVDTFNPPKVLLGFRMDKVPESEWVGNCDLPSIWNQAQREKMRMHLHWDGNNDSLEERDRSASFGTGATPPTLDRDSMRRMESWLRSDANVPPPYPADRIDAARAARGRPIYESLCAKCHGKDGKDFTGEYVGQVTPIEDIGTDRRRLDSYSPELCANQNLLYAAYPSERFQHFRKTYGYANQPLDGIWLRAPYLHNGSVATLRELLEPASKRRAKFFRGYDVYDHVRGGFVSDVREADGRVFFEFDTSLPGNGNRGHEGAAYGTTLPDADKDALVEYLKTF